MKKNRFRIYLGAALLGFIETAGNDRTAAIAIFRLEHGIDHRFDKLLVAIPVE